MSVEHMVRDTYDQVFGGERNLSTLERVASAGFGLILAAAGVRRADGPGAVMGVAGAALVARGMSGHCPLKALAQGDHGGGEGGQIEHQNRMMADRVPNNVPDNVH